MRASCGRNAQCTGLSNSGRGPLEALSSVMLCIRYRTMRRYRTHIETDARPSTGRFLAGVKAGSDSGMGPRYSFPTRLPPDRTSLDAPRAVARRRVPRGHAGVALWLRHGPGGVQEGPEPARRGRSPSPGRAPASQLASAGVGALLVAGLLGLLALDPALHLCEALQFLPGGKVAAHAATALLPRAISPRSMRVLPEASRWAICFQKATSVRQSGYLAAMPYASTMRST